MFNRHGNLELLNTKMNFESTRHSAPLESSFIYVAGGRNPPFTKGIEPWRSLQAHLLAVTQDGAAGAVYEVDRHGKPPLKAAQGEVFIIPVGETFRVRTVNDSPSSGYWIHFQINAFGARDLFSFYDLPDNLGSSLRIAHLMHRLIKLPATLGLHESIEQQLVGFQLVSGILEQAVPREETHGWIGDISRVRVIIRRIRENPAERIPLDELAASLGVSEPHFLAVFRNATGMTPGEFRERERFLRACELLRNSYMKFSAIANELGYSDAFHFSRRFKAFYGLSPKEFRKNASSSTFG